MALNKDKEKDKKKATTESDSPIGTVTSQGIVEEMQQSYLDYAMSVIVGRALPDVRDGLKPVQRRILYTMWLMGLTSKAKFRKSAAIVGDVLGKFHPHGDTAVYDAMVRLAQTFSLREPLVMGQGNFGSMDGDGAAAMRYTEAKLSALAEEILTDIEKETVPFGPNYDGTQQEPHVMPAKVPNLLINGTAGIAVGMATSIPPHNLGEVIDATVYLIDNPEATTQDLLQFIPGPDFPTGAIIYDRKEIHQAYGTGKGSIVARAKAEVVEEKSGWQIIVTEIPYQVNKALMIEHMANLVRDKKIEGIRDLRDESDREGVRVVIELKRDSYPKKILNQLYKHTEMQTSFHLNMLALVDGVQPRVLNLKTILEEFIKHRQVVIRKRTEYDLAKAKERAHILEGLKIAVDNIDAVVKIIKQSTDRSDAKQKLITKFKLSDRQADAILDMRLSQLANLERLKIENELKEKRALIKELDTLLASPKKILAVIQTELKIIKEKYANPRRTQVVVGALDEFKQEDLIPDEATVVAVTRDGYIKRLAPETFRTQSRGGKGVVGLTTKEEDVVAHLLSTNTHADLLFFTDKGRVFQLKAYEVPVASRQAKGSSIVNFLQLAPQESVTAVLPVTAKKSAEYYIMGTAKGMVKRLKATELANVRRSGLLTIRLRSGDTLRWVRLSAGKDDIMFVTREGQAIRFPEKTTRTMGRSAAGVRGIKLKGKDEVVTMDIVPGGAEGAAAELLVVSEYGFGKRTKLNQYKVQGRGGSGVKTADVTKKIGVIVGAAVILPAAEKEEIQDVIMISSGGQVIRLAYKGISVLGRVTQGVRLMRLKDDKERLVAMTTVN